MLEQFEVFPVKPRSHWFVVMGALVAMTGVSCGADQALPPAIVSVIAVGCGPVERIATGFAVGPDRVVTVAHTLRGATEIRVSDEAARLVGIDHRTDVAVLATTRRLPGSPTTRFAPPAVGAARVGRSPDQITVSITKVAPIDIDEPRDTAQYRRDGLVASVTDRGDSIVSGDSGSPVIDAQGRVVGVVFATDRDSGHSAFATSSTEVQALLRSAGTESVSTGACDL